MLMWQLSCISLVLPAMVMGCCTNCVIIMVEVYAIEEGVMLSVIGWCAQSGLGGIQLNASDISRRKC